MSFAARPRLILTLAVALTVSRVDAQNPPVGRIVGRVLNTSTGDVIAGAQVTVLGTSIAQITDWQGRFALLGVPAGRWSISVRAIGFTPKTVTDVDVAPDASIPLDVSLDGAIVQLEGISVTAAQERGSVSAALNRQRTASEIVNAVTAEQIERSPDGDAGQAVQRVSGVTVQDGKYVFVRGLGERYTTTALNNARLPSPEPERKEIPFDLFPSNLLESITTTKTFTPEQPGDFSGASVNLKTRDFPLQRLLSLSLGGAGNTSITGRDMLQAPSLGGEWSGFAADGRRLPVEAAAIRSPSDLAALSPTEINGVIGSFRNAWSAGLGAAPAVGSFGVNAGGQADLAHSTLGYLASLTYATSRDARADERRALAVTDDGGGTRPQNAYFGSTGTASVLWGGMANLSAHLGPGTTLATQHTVTVTADNQATRLAGANEEFATDFQLARLTFTERLVHSDQLTGEHRFGDRHHLDWAATWSGVRRYEPGRSDLVYLARLDTIAHTAQPLEWWGAPRSAVRTFSDLRETGAEVAVNYRLSFGPPARSDGVKVGVDVRAAHRTADTRAFDVVNNDLSDAERSAPPETIFDGRYASAGQLLLFIDANGGHYTARDRVAAGFAQLELGLGERLRIVTGARIEQARLDVDTRTAQGDSSSPRLDDLDVLPAAALTFRLTATQNLRLSASQTLSRPEYRELSQVPYADVLGGLTVFGNPGLRRALIQNYDARWEWYPEPAEVVSVAFFAKRFAHPIEKVIVGQTGASALSFVNAEGATNLGVELELRRSLAFIEPGLRRFTTFANATLMKSRIRPGNDSIASNTSHNRPMIGQAAYVVNAGAIYVSDDARFTATVLYNVVGRRIVEVGQLPLPDAYEQPRHVLDASAQLQLTHRFAVKLDGKNLLDARYRVTQGTVSRLAYRAGRVVGIGLALRP